MSASPFVLHGLLAPLSCASTIEHGGYMQSMIGVKSGQRVNAPSAIGLEYWPSVRLIDVFDCVNKKILDLHNWNLFESESLSLYLCKLADMALEVVWMSPDGKLLSNLMCRGGMHSVRLRAPVPHMPVPVCASESHRLRSAHALA